MQYVKHPRKININGFLFEVLSVDPLTDKQAANAARFFFRTHKLKTKDKGKLISIHTSLDSGSAGIFGG